MGYQALHNFYNDGPVCDVSEQYYLTPLSRGARNGTIYINYHHLNDKGVIKPDILWIFWILLFQPL